MNNQDKLINGGNDMDRLTNSGTKTQEQAEQGGGRYALETLKGVSDFTYLLQPILPN